MNANILKCIDFRLLEIDFRNNILMCFGDKLTIRDFSTYLSKLQYCNPCLKSSEKAQRRALS